MTTHAAAELAGQELAEKSGANWTALTSEQRQSFVVLASDQGVANGLLVSAKSKLTAEEFAAVINAAKADAYRDVRRQLVWSTEAFKAKQIEMVQLSDDLADLVTANGGHYRKPSLNPRFPEGTPEYTEYAAKLRAALAEPGAFDFLEH